MKRDIKLASLGLLHLGIAGAAPIAPTTQILMVPATGGEQLPLDSLPGVTVSIDAAQILRMDLVNHDNTHNRIALASTANQTPITPREVYVIDLAAHNHVSVALADGRSCAAAFDAENQLPAIIGPITCR